jgi:DNA-binding NtrC family response regulator
MKLLVVDDDKVNRMVLTKALAKLYPEFDIEEFPDGESAVKAIENEIVDIVITDLVMPGISGLDVLESAKVNNMKSEVIVITAHASIGTAVEAMRKGARDYIEKPVSIPLLKEKLDHILEYIMQVKESEDYRFAKEATEDSASQSLMEMEKMLFAHKAVLNNIKDIIHSESDDSEKVRKINQELSEKDDI